MIHIDLPTMLSTSHTAGVLRAAQEQSSLTQELVMLIILVVIALALILVCGLLGRREAGKGEVEMGRTAEEPPPTIGPEAAKWQATAATLTDAGYLVDLSAAPLPLTT